MVDNMKEHKCYDCKHWIFVDTGAGGIVDTGLCRKFLFDLYDNTVDKEFGCCSWKKLSEQKRHARDIVRQKMVESKSNLQKINKTYYYEILLSALQEVFGIDNE